MYQLIPNPISSDWVIRLSDKALVHIENQAYLAWLEEGNEPLPADAPAETA